ncbi:S8 family serine peptidase [Streptomyces sp. NPDC002825]|uniref:S8 family serine peptidase n=1 Tax=Streptomyces sp. NPDC002825 TaxID=3154666 RepID=UPI00331DBDE0
MRAEMEGMTSGMRTQAVKYSADSMDEFKKDVDKLIDNGAFGLAPGAKGSLVFASVGNSGDTSNVIEYPGATPGVVGVGAVDDKGKRIPVSEYGPQVDVVAPGKDMVHACGGGTGLCKGTGTNDAAAIASAAAALLWSKHPDWTNNQVLKVMLNTVAGPSGGEKRSNHVGFGALRPLRTLKTPGDPGPADVRPIDDLTEAPKATPTPSADPSSAAPAPSESTVAPAPALAAQASKDGSTALWIGLGIGAAVLIGAAVAVPVLRSRRG